VYSREELQIIGDLCVKNNIIILSDEVYDRLYYVPFTRIATLSPEISKLTLTVGSAGKNFYATGWRVGYLIGEPHLIKYVAAAHTRICYSSVSPLQEAAAVGFEQADKEGFWDHAVSEMKGKMKRFNEVWDELGLPVDLPALLFCSHPDSFHSTLIPKVGTLCSSTCPKSAYHQTINFHLMWPNGPGTLNSVGF
jgi:kynurenine aminotransferase